MTRLTGFIFERQAKHIGALLCNTDFGKTQPYVICHVSDYQLSSHALLPSLFRLYNPGLRQPDLSLLLLDAKLAQPDPGHYTSQHKHTGHNDSPMLHMCNVQAIRGPARCTNGRKTQCRNDIARHPVVLVNRLGIIYASVNLWHVILREAHERLDVYENVKCKSETCVRRLEVFVAWPGFVHLDDD
jgi:hypothetical protein